MPKILWDKLANDAVIQKTITSLKENGIEACVVENKEEAKQKALEMIPQKSEVMTMTSMTLEAIGLDEEINKSGRFISARDKLFSMNKNAQAEEMNKIGAAPQYVLGSVHAVSQDGHALIASATGSQLPAYVYGALKVIWVVGAQKIVKNTEQGIKRIYEYTFPLEDARARKAYGMGSGVNKLLIVNKEVNAGRIAMIIVKEKLGF